MSLGSEPGEVCGGDLSFTWKPRNRINAKRERLQRSFFLTGQSFPHAWCGYPTPYIIWQDNSVFQMRRVYSPCERLFAPIDLRRIAQSLNSLSSEEQTQIRCLDSHGVQLGVHRFVIRDCLYITLVRNPIDWMLSSYYFTLNNPRAHDHELYHRENTFALR